MKIAGKRVKGRNSHIINGPELRKHANEGKLMKNPRKRSSFGTSGEIYNSNGLFRHLLIEPQGSVGTLPSTGKYKLKIHLLKEALKLKEKDIKSLQKEISLSDGPRLIEVKKDQGVTMRQTKAQVKDAQFLKDSLIQRIVMNESRIESLVSLKERENKLEQNQQFAAQSLCAKCKAFCDLTSELKFTICRVQALLF